MTQLRIDPHPLLVPATFETVFPRSLGEIEPSETVLHHLRDGEGAPLTREEEVRKAVRDLLRQGGYKPTGRGKPASEYLVRAAGEGALSSINAAVDVCNAVSLASGLPISVVDLDRTVGALRIGLAEPDSRYVFNASGQEIDVSGLLCLFDEEGPCANAVKDAQRTKTSPETRRTFTVIWGCLGHEERLAQSESWYRELLAGFGAETRDVAP